MIKARAAALVVALASAALTDCTLDAFCTEGAPGCVDPGCHDGRKNGDETDVDCGGACAPCAVGATCAEPTDCATSHCVGGRCCEAPCGIWASAFGGLGYDAVRSIAVAPDGGVFVAGVFSGIVDFGGGPLASAGKTDAFVLKLDASGKHVWSVRLGAEADDAAARVAVTAAGHPVIAIQSAGKSLDLGGEVLGGASEENVYLVELDGAGKHVWSRAYPGAMQNGGLAIAPDGDLVLVTSVYYVDLGAAGTFDSKGGYDVLVARLGPEGEPRWAKRYGSTFHDVGIDVAVDADGALYVLVRYALLWSFGGVILPPSGGNVSIGIAKLDGTGKHIWSRGIQSQPIQDQFPNAVAVDDTGTVWLTGILQGTLDVGAGPIHGGVAGGALVVSLEAATGTPRWARSFGENSAEASAAVPDGRGGVVFSGRYRGTVDFGGGVTLVAGLDQLFVARLDGAGNAVWARGETGVVGGTTSKLAASPSGDRIFLAGSYRGTLDVGTGPHPSAGEEDAFVAALVP